MIRPDHSISFPSDSVIFIQSRSQSQVSTARGKYIDKYHSCQNFQWCLNRLRRVHFISYLSDSVIFIQSIQTWWSGGNIVTSIIVVRIQNFQWCLNRLRRVSCQSRSYLYKAGVRAKYPDQTGGNILQYMHYIVTTQGCCSELNIVARCESALHKEPHLRLAETSSVLYNSINNWIICLDWDYYWAKYLDLELVLLFTLTSNWKSRLFWW